METKTLYRLIEDETPILPYVVAETVVAEYYSKSKIEVDSEEKTRQCEDLIAYLINRANELYNINSHFKKKIREKGNNGRDNLYMFMGHWLEAKIFTEKSKRNATPNT